MDKLLDALAVLSIVMIFVVMRSLRREHIRVEHSVSWLAAAIALLAFSRSHGLLRFAARQLGFESEAGPLLLAILSVFLVVFYRFSAVVSGLKDMNITLIQRIAILEYQLREKNEDSQKKA